jgi:hypothetical protein
LPPPASRAVLPLQSPDHTDCLPETLPLPLQEWRKNKMLFSWLWLGVQGHKVGNTSIKPTNRKKSIKPVGGLVSPPEKSRAVSGPALATLI